MSMLPMGLNGYAQGPAGPAPHMHNVQPQAPPLPPLPPPPPPQQQQQRCFEQQQQRCFAPPIHAFHPQSPMLQRSHSDGCEYQSPHTSYHSRLQTRLHPGEAQHMPAHHFNPYYSAPTTVEQQREQLLTAIVIDRLCAWGEHRAAPEWPSELVAPGPVPALVDALLSTRTRTLTLPQLITAIKERTGGGACGKALDMLNLKAYVRCFPSLFSLQSGRTSSGRPLDSVELRATDAVAAQPHYADAMTSRMERHAIATAIAASAWSAHGMQPGRPSMSIPMSSPMLNPLMSPLPPPALSPAVLHHQPCANVPPSCANQPRTSSVYERIHPMSPLQPKDLFGVSSGAAGFASAPAEAPSATDAMWSPGGSERFSFFGGPGGAAGSESSFHIRRSSAANDDHPPTILHQLNELFESACAVDDASAGAPAASIAAPGSPPDSGIADSARRAFRRKFNLDRLFDEATDRAMRHNVASPVEFIAHELLNGLPLTPCV